MTVSDDDIWAPHGREWWENEAREVGARDPRHAAFAAARYRGHNRTQAARLAGYSDERATRAGSEADRARAVKLLKIAAQNKAREDGVDAPSQPLTLDEIERLLDDDIRRGTRQERHKATELWMKLFGDRQRKTADNSDCLGEWRLARSYLKIPNGAAAFALLWHGMGRSISCMPMFHDVAALAKREQPNLWTNLVRQHSDVMQLDLREREAEPDWQRETREKIWAEVGVSIDEADRKAFGIPDGAAKPAPEANPEVKQTAAA